MAAPLISPLIEKQFFTAFRVSEQHFVFDVYIGLVGYEVKLVFREFAVHTA